MAVVSQHQEDHISSSSTLLLDALYCEEGQWEEQEEEEEEEEVAVERSGFAEEERLKSGISSQSLLPLLFLDQDLLREDEELHFLFAKEEKQQIQWVNNNMLGAGTDEPLCLARREALEWMLKVNAHHGFSTLTAILAINYLDRFLSTVRFQEDKPWMIQLSAVTCLSLAAKVEESHIPLLLDLQVHGTEYLFDTKTIQKMELLVLSSLEWNMHPVTPLSFLGHITRRLGLKTQTQCEFLRRCDRLLLSVVSDWRLARYPPSVLATATMLHVIDQIEPLNPIDYQNRLLGVLNIGKGKVIECYQGIVEATGSSSTADLEWDWKKDSKRKYEQVPSSPSGVIDGYFSCESSNDSWAVVGSPLSSSPAVIRKRSRVSEQRMPLPSLSRVFAEAVWQSPS